MNYKSLILLFLFSLAGLYANAQKPFVEGIIIYKVTLQPAGNKEFSGVYKFTFKGSEIKKELRLDNGYEDVVIYNCATSKIFSLQNRGGKKYAIELKMADLQKTQEKFAGYVIKNEEANQKNIAGYAVYKGNINYHDGSFADIAYTKEWKPSQAIVFERFPDAKFMPLHFIYKDENGVTMQFDAEKIEPGPVENSVFRVPPDYKMISNEEYKQLTK